MENQYPSTENSVQLQKYWALSNHAWTECSIYWPNMYNTAFRWWALDQKIIYNKFLLLAARIALKWRGDQGTPELVWAAAQ